jgi:hypothetical protein
MAINDLTDSLMDYLADLLDEGRVDINDAMKAKGYNDFEIAQIWKDSQKIIAKYPSIAIMATNKEVKWSATRMRDETYNFNIDCLTKIIKKEESARYVRCFGSAVQNWLNDFNNLRRTIKGTSILVFDSWAGGVEYGYKHDGAIRVARVTWYAKTANPVSV